ncbi:MAG: HEPN domain-containing protein [Phycisphaerales bacterium]
MNKSIPQQWAEQAKYDFETAHAMLDSGRYLYVLFCCQQAVEKMAKAIIAQRTGEFPPRLHDLMRLAGKADIKPDADQALLMRQLSEYYIQSRYPDDIARMGKGVTHELARNAMDRTEVLLQWLQSML